MNLPETLQKCRERTADKLAQLITGLTDAGAPTIVSARACVYATGSLGRGEMSERSDLDIFILRDRNVASPLTNLDEICLKARLVEVARQQKYEDFSGDGKYLKAHDVKEDLIGKLGTSEDDSTNVFTARMLLLLESRPILGADIYKQAIDLVVSLYWRDYAQNSTNFLPLFLINDILRFWKTLCLNYEERTGAEKHTKPGKRRLHNYKLKHSRLLTCYSGIIYLQAILCRDGGTVSPKAVMDMVSRTPTERLEDVAGWQPSMEPAVQKIMDGYAKFLQICDANKPDLEESFSDPGFKQARFTEAKHFGDDVFHLLHLLTTGTELLRYLVI